MLFAQISLTVATLLCSLVAGFLFAFAVVVMPGLRNLPDREFIRAFQEIDGVIQRGQPLFGAVWLGSALALGLSIALGLGQFDGTDRLLLLAAGHEPGTLLEDRLARRLEEDANVRAVNLFLKHDLTRVA